MNNYELMIVLDPKVEARVAHNLVEEVFGKEAIVKENRLEITDLAYPINKSNKGQFVNFEIKAKPELVAEFTRKANILKTVWRTLVINLDTEKGRNKEFKPRKSKNIFYSKDNKKKAPFTNKKVFSNGEKPMENKKVFVKKNKPVDNTNTVKENK